MADELRVLAERLGMLQDCECGGEVVLVDGFNDDPSPLLCPGCKGLGNRLPTEAEVRAAIFEAGWGFVDLFAESGEAQVEVTKSASQGPVHTIRVEAPETDSDDLLLLALLRALEVARG